MKTGAPDFPARLTEAIDHAVLRRLREPTGRELARCLRGARAALREGTQAQALRLLDRAWRLQLDADESLASLYGRLLFLDGGDFEAALRLLERARVHAPDPDDAALIALAWRRLGRGEPAQRQLEGALAAFCVVPDGLLAAAAAEFCADPSTGFVGWMGRGPDLALIGELAERVTSAELEIQLAGAQAFTQRLNRGAAAQRLRLQVPLPASSPGAALAVSIRGVPLLGSGAATPTDFGLDGRIEPVGGRIGGWVRLGWDPTRAPALRIENEQGLQRKLQSGAHAPADWRWPYACDRPTVAFGGARIEIRARLPDGRWLALPDSPFLQASAVRLARRGGARLAPWSRATAAQPAAPAPTRVDRPPAVDVIIPVYGGRDAALECIDAALATTGPRTRVVVVDDGSNDSQLTAALEQRRTAGRVTVIRLPQNQGFVRAANRALALSTERDAVLLNSDARVFGDWLARLRAAAYSGPRIATVTPWSNSGSIASFPHPHGSALDPAAAATLDALAAATHARLRLEIPVGVGFCLYLRRDCLRETGAFDADVFGMGYGEETDFCLRARRRGWSHVLAADVYVQHTGGLSFGARRAALLARARRLIELRHPGYERFVQSFASRDPLQPARRALDEARLRAAPGRCVLLVSVALRGGVARYVEERGRELRAQGLIPLVLRAAEPYDLRRCELASVDLDLPNLRYTVPGELDALAALLGSIRLQSVEIQHFLHLDARVMELVRALPVPQDVRVHDYAWVCPRVNLIDHSGRYCGEPAPAVCERCVRRNGSALGERLTVAALRARSARWLGAARQVFAPSADTAARLRRYFPKVPIHVQAPPAATPPPSPPPPPRESAPEHSRHATVRRVALLGAIGEQKGYAVLLACARDARARALPLEFVVVGKTMRDAPLFATGRVFVTGAYGETEAEHLLRREAADLAFFPSLSPETWCYALDHALAAGLPIVAFDFGAIAERLRAAGQGELLPLGLEAARINDRLLGAATRKGLMSDQRKLPAGSSTMKDPNKTPQQSTPAEAGLTASVQILPLPPGMYLFTVKAAHPAAGHANAPLALPAIHVGVGPGVRADQAEFVAGRPAQGGWLYAEQDVLVAKIADGGATMLLTSVRAAGGEALSIKVERLDARVAQPSTPAGAPGLAAAPATPAPPLAGPAVPSGSDVPLQIMAHVRSRGDMRFDDVAWAGREGPGLWIESFSVVPLAQFRAADLEYKGLTGSGFETPWISDGNVCGTKAMATPLIGFAIRFKQDLSQATHDCEYSGYFQSGVVVGPLRNGAPCRSTVANDPLEGIQVRILRRAAAAAKPMKRVAKSTRAKQRGIRPRS